MAENKDIIQNIKLNYQTNADATGKQVNELSSSVEQVTEAQKENTSETLKNNEATKSMRTQVKEATMEMYKLAQTYGETSKEAVGAAKKVAELKDVMKSQKDLVDNFDPDQKFKALGASTQLAATGMSAVTSGMALFGDNSKETEKQLLKVQSAMAFSQSISQLSNLGDQYKTLKAVLTASYASITAIKTADTLATEANAVAENQSFLGKAKNVVVNGVLAVTTGVATAATWLWTSALMANPAIAIAAAVIALGSAIYGLTKYFMDSSDASKKAESANKKLSSEIDNLEKSAGKANEAMAMNNNHSLAMAKAHGKSSEEIRKLSLELANSEVAEKRLNAVKAQSILLEAIRIAGLEDATDAQKETAKKANESFKKLNEDYNNSLTKRKQLVLDNEVEVATEERQAEEKRKADRKKASDDRLAAQKKAADERKAQVQKDLDEIAKEDEAARLITTDSQIKGDELALKKIDDKYAKQLELHKKYGKSTVEIEAAIAAEKKVITDAADTKKAETDKKYADELALFNAEGWKAKLNEQLRQDQEALDKQNLTGQAKIDAQALLTGKYNNAVKVGLKTEAEATDEANKKAISDAQAVADAKNAIQNAQLDIASKGIAMLQGLGIKNKAIQKGLVIAENVAGIAKIIINTMAANSKAALESPLTGGMPFVAMNTISAGIGVASSIAATVKALSALGGGGDASGGAGGAASIPQGASATPQVGFQTSAENQIGTTIANNTNAQAPIQAYVVANEVTTAQTLNRNKIDANSI